MPFGLWTLPDKPPVPMNRAERRAAARRKRKAKK